jgi:hypothetical protein
VVPAAQRIAVLYDRDCGFCKWALNKILVWDRRRRLRPVAIQSEEGNHLLAAIAPERRLESWHLVTDGEVRSAGAAAPQLFEGPPAGGAASCVPAAYRARVPVGGGAPGAPREAAAHRRLLRAQALSLQRSHHKLRSAASPV